MKKKEYQKPTVKLVTIQQSQVLCASNGSFGLSSNKIEAGDDSALTDEDFGW